MFDWVKDLISGIGDAIGNALSGTWTKISNGIFDVFFKWIYNIIYNAIADFFTMMGNLGAGLFDLSWVKAFIKLFSLFGWALFVVGLIVAIFDTAIEYQSMERINIKRQILPFLYGFLAVNLFTIVPVRLYCFAITTQNIFMKGLSGLAVGQQAADLNSAAHSALGMVQFNPAKISLVNMLFMIALAYCVIKIFFANIKRGGILLTQIAVGSLYMFSIPKGNTEGFIQWCRQVIALCLTAFLQMTLLYLGLITWKTDMLLGLGVMLAANEVPQIAKQFGLDTSAKVTLQQAAYTTASVVNVAKTIARK